MIDANMPFGKHKGQRVSELPADYLFWLHENVDLSALLAAAVRHRIERLNQTPAAPVNRIDYRAIRRKYAAKYHPDRTGGNRIAMTAINELMDEIEGVAR